MPEPCRSADLSNGPTSMNVKVVCLAHTWRAFVKTRLTISLVRPLTELALKVFRFHLRLERDHR